MFDIMVWKAWSNSLHMLSSLLDSFVESREGLVEDIYDIHHKPISSIEQNMYFEKGQYYLVFNRSRTESNDKFTFPENPGQPSNFSEVCNAVFVFLSLFW
jgi:hypothetical protein